MRIFMVHLVCYNQSIHVSDLVVNDSNSIKLTKQVKHKKTETNHKLINKLLIICDTQ